MLDAVYLPPATQSDLLSAITTYQPDVIGLIDGVFMQLLSVWHKEILYALERGVRVYGSSSMGALRAAETDVFGMVGVGEVYRQYASGEINDDDEVAVLHSDADFGYRALSEPMVNLRATFRRAAQEDVIDDETCRQLVGIAKALYFPERSYAAIFQQATVAGLPDDVLRRMRQFIATSPVDLKRQDALQLLQIVRDLPDPLPQMDATFTMTRSHLFAAQFNRDRTVRHREVDVSLATIGDFAAIHASSLRGHLNALRRATPTPDDRPCPRLETACRFLRRGDERTGQPHTGNGEPEFGGLTGDTHRHRASPQHHPDGRSYLRHSRRAYRAKRHVR